MAAPATTQADPVASVPDGLQATARAGTQRGDVTDTIADAVDRLSRVVQASLGRAAANEARCQAQPASGTHRDR